MFACSLQGRFINLAVLLDDVNSLAWAVCEGGDLLGTCVLSHPGGATSEGFDKHHHLVGSHPKTIGKCLVI
jgi:hypothetical protein